MHNVEELSKNKPDLKKRVCWLHYPSAYTTSPRIATFTSALNSMEIALLSRQLSRYTTFRKELPFQSLFIRPQGIKEGLLALFPVGYGRTCRRPFRISYFITFLDSGHQRFYTCSRVGNHGFYFHRRTSAQRSEIRRASLIHLRIGRWYGDYGTESLSIYIAVNFIGQNL